MKVVLTGGAGFIGSQVLRAYLRQGHEVIVVDDLSHGRREALPEGVPLYALDICDRQALIDLFRELKPQVVNHHAALVNVRESVGIPERYFAINTEGTQKIMQAVRACGAQKLIFASSGGAIYGEALQLPVPEGHPLKPLSPYAESKALAEQALLGQDGRMPTIILRYGNVYGPGQDPTYGNGAIAIFARAMRQREPIAIFGDGHQIRDYVFVEDAAQANLAALAFEGSGIFNVGTGQGRELLEVADDIARILGLEYEARFLPAHAFEVEKNVLDVSRAERVLGWRASVPFESGLRRTLEWLEQAERQWQGHATHD